jgi:SAM-dependent methyltransferase
MLKLLLTVLVAAGATSARPQDRLAPFVATPDDVVHRMLRLGGVGPSDVVYDIGSGDGRVVIMAASRFGARGVGIEIDPGLVRKAQQAAAAAGVAGRVTFRLQDALTADVSDATVVTLYLLAASNIRLRPILTRQLRPGARIVAHEFPMGSWDPTAVDAFVDAGGKSRTLLLWRFDGVFRP